MPARSQKRQRITGPTKPPPDPGADKHAKFEQWAKSRGVVSDAVKAAPLPGRGYGLLTTRAVKKGERLVFVPEKAMFKPDPALKGRGRSHLSPQADLAVSLMLAMPEMPEIKDVLPESADFEAGMPMTWPENLQKLLPPGALQPLHRQLKDFEADFKAAEEDLSSGEFDAETLNGEAFRYCWMVVNSRSFHFKPEGRRDGYMVLCPFLDYMNHVPSGQGCHVNVSAEGYEVVADRNYGPKQEICATYGAHSNDKLLVHYGFIIASDSSKVNNDDEVRLDDTLLKEMSDEQKAALQDVGFLGGYALLPATNELCFKSQVAIRSLFLTSNEWEHFMNHGEDLGEDKSLHVGDWTRAPLRCCCGNARGHIMALESMLKGDISELDRTRAELLKRRWLQIDAALEAFLDTTKPGILYVKAK